jgi:putative transcriptional regulator
MLNINQISNEKFPCLTGQFLIAMPGMHDLSFEKSVIYICAHSVDGAMGIIVNRAINTVTFSDMLEQLEIEEPFSDLSVKVHFGGPVESERGFVLHTNDYLEDTTLEIDQNLSLTATQDILKALAIGSGPYQSLLVLGYAGWGPGQLDEEIKSNGWLSVSADKDLVFDHDLDGKWSRAMEIIGIDPYMLSKSVGHA